MGFCPDSYILTSLQVTGVAENSDFALNDAFLSSLINRTRQTDGLVNGRAMSNTGLRNRQHGVSRDNPN